MISSDCGCADAGKVFIAGGITDGFTISGSNGIVGGTPTDTYGPQQTSGNLAVGLTGNL